jgi:hypothetical protein
MQRSKTPNSIAPENCPSCEAPFQGKFCSQCGEKQTSAQDFTIKKYAKSLFEHFSHLDSKLLRSVWFLISKPGFLSAEFVAGRQNLYMSLGLLLYALFYRQNPYYICNLIFATHWFSFLIIFLMFTGFVLAFCLQIHGLPLLGAILLLLLPHHILAIRYFYGQSWPITILKSIIFLTVFCIIFLLYRSAILYLTFWMI